MTFNKVLCGLLVSMFFVLSTNVYAVSQWSRKYGVSCTTCHTPAFPRLNYKGEKFQLNGYQDVGKQDGDTTGKQAIGKEGAPKRLFIDELQNFFGVRLNVVPVKVQWPGTRVNFGNPNWAQFFTAGSIFKNVSIWIETELTTTSPSAAALKHAWFRMGFHNLFDTQLLNMWVGVLDPLELHATSGRLPMIPAIEQEVFRVQSSGGNGEDSVDLRGGKPAIVLYGSSGAFVYSVGIDNGKALSDVNTSKNYFGTLKAQVTDGAFEGSAVSLFGYTGKDTKWITSTTLAENNFWRISPAVNLRWNDWDMLAAFVYGSDSNWTIATNAGDKKTFYGMMLQAGYPLSDEFYAAAQYDGVWLSDGPTTSDISKIGFALSYQPRENWRIMLVPRADILPVNTTTHTKASHDFQVMIRTMF
ncbi:MAG: hypothetical protein HY537_10015 [Deltaproteobacteria bacterium]|nr:hypothetical protein [Deltaproteobacteria bacterium]